MGEHALQVTRKLKDPVRVLRPRADVPEQELTVFELMCLMQQDEWVCCIKPCKAADSGDHLKLTHMDYCRDGALQWWLQGAAQSSVMKEYLLASTPQRFQIVPLPAKLRFAF